MSRAEHVAIVYAPEAATAGRSGDPVLAALGQAEATYAATRAAWEGAVADARAARDEALGELDLARAEAERERVRAAWYRERADRFADALKDIHRAAFRGNVFDYILKACMTITGAARGLYVTAAGGDVRVRAAHHVDGYPAKPPSAFVRALCDKVLADKRSFVANEPHEFARFPAPDGPGEAFDDCLVAPAVLLTRLNGVVILADKSDGFDDDDVAEVMSVGDQAGVAVENSRLQDDLLRAYFSVVGVLADAIEAKDPYTKGHSELVARLSRLTAARLADDPKLRSVACYGGLLHDVGKIGVSDGVLNKPGKLLPEEWDLMRSHVRIGRDLLAHVPALDGVADVVLSHHERYDGGGYPDGLTGDAIPLAARIVCVADAYCAMISKRSYKESATPADARAELARCKGTHFDPRVVDAFLAVLDDPASHDECPDGCDLLPHLQGWDDDFRHAVRG